LADLIFKWGEERYSRRIARKIVEARDGDPIRTSRQLADLVVRCVPKNPREKIHPATRTFQALRIAVNHELDELARMLAKLPALLKPGGRAVIISFHSLEDRQVKEAFQDSLSWERLTRKPLRPGDAEINANPRSRSAKLRAARRIGSTM
jgi:16S rRNA (cytosine1402-N4)-methyltransferase